MPLRVPQFLRAVFQRPLPHFLSSVAGHPLRAVVETGKIFAACHVFVAYGWSVGYCDGPSMLPTFEVMGDWLVTSKHHRYGRGVVVGDLVAYTIPIYPESEGVKRVVGMPGDYVLMNSPDSTSDTMIQVPKGHCWLVGDNLPASRDSRTFGPVPLGLIKGKVIAKILPLSEAHWMKNPFEGQGGGRLTTS